MTSLSSYVQNNPVADNSTGPGFFGKIGNGIKNYASGIKNTVSSNFNEAKNAIENANDNPLSQNGSLGSGLAAGATVFKDAAGALVSPITQAIKPVADATGVTSGLNSIGQGFVNTPVGQATTDLLSKAPDKALGAASDVFQGASDTAVLAGATELPDKVSNIWEKVRGTPSDPITARTADATPAYNKDLIGQNTRTPEGQIVPRVNEGKGLTGSRTVNTSASEAEQGQELANLPNYPDNGTALEKSLAIGKGIGTEAEGMRTGLQTEDRANPLDAPTEIAKVSDLVKSNLPKDIQESLGTLTPEDQAMLKGMNEKAGVAQPKGGFDLSSPGESKFLPKTAAGRYYRKVLDALRNYDGTREGKLNLRQAVENAYQSEGGKYIYGSDSHNALAETNTDIRNALNKDLADTTKDTNTQASLKKQTNLYRAKDTLETKAQTEAASTIGRFFQSHPLLHRLATRDFMRVAATASGAGILGSYITKLLQGKK